MSTLWAKCLLLAQSGHGDRAPQCPLSGEERTSLERTPWLLAGRVIRGIYCGFESHCGNRTVVSSKCGRFCGRKNCQALSSTWLISSNGEGWISVSLAPPACFRNLLSSRVRHFKRRPDLAQRKSKLCTPAESQQARISSLGPIFSESSALSSKGTDFQSEVNQSFLASQTETSSSPPRLPNRSAKPNRPLFERSLGCRRPARRDFASFHPGQAHSISEEHTPYKSP
jgi:hypothetical protein